MKIFKITKDYTKCCYWLEYNGVKGIIRWTTPEKYVPIIVDKVIRRGRLRESI